MTVITAAMIVAAAANIAALIAILFAHRASERAFRAMDNVSSSRASRLEAASSSRSDCLSASQASAALPTSSVRPANSNLVCVSPSFSNTSRCGSGFGVGMEEFGETDSVHGGSPQLRLVLPNVRAKRRAAAWRLGRVADDKATRLRGPGAKPLRVRA